MGHVCEMGMFLPARGGIRDNITSILLGCEHRISNVGILLYVHAMVSPHLLA